MEMQTISVLVIMNILLIVMIYVANRRIRKQSYLRQLDSIKVNASLKELLVNIQKQRGLCLRYINGEQSLDKDIKFQISTIDSAISKVEYGHSKFLDSDPRWSSIRQDWADLKNQIMQLDEDRSFIKHNMLIESLIFMIGDIADRGQNEAKTLVTNEESKIIWVNIPQTLEALGRTRAIGSGVASAGSCSQANKIKLKYLIEEITKNYQKVSVQLDALKEGSSMQSSQQMSEKVNGFVTTVTKQLIQPEAPQITSAHFFQQATQTMDILSSLFDQLTLNKEQKLIRAIG